MKKLRNVLVAVVLIAGIAVLVFVLQFRAMTKGIDDQVTTVEAVDLGRLVNGVYAGGFSKYLMSLGVRVAIANSAIVSADIVDHTFYKGHEGLETVDRIVQAQSPKVDTVSGATASSKCIMIAVHRALTGEPEGDIGQINLEESSIGVLGGINCHFIPNSNVNPYVSVLVGFVDTETETYLHGYSSSEEEHDLGYSLGGFDKNHFSHPTSR